MARALLALAVVAGSSHVARAQAGLPGRLELGGGLRLSGSETFSPVESTESIPGGGERTVFVTRSRLEPALSGDVRVGARLSPMLWVDGTVAIGNATLATTIEDDIEVVGPVTARESVRQYLVEGTLTASPARWRWGRWFPFVLFGGGYLRQLHEGRTLLDTGRTVYVGAGARYALTGAGGRGVPSGLRLDVRGALVSGGIAVDDRSHGVPVLNVSYFVRF